MPDANGKGRPVPVPASRIGRLTRLGSMTAGIAGNMAVNGAVQMGQGKRPSLRDLILTPRNIGRVTEQLAQMRGAAMKVGQLVSMDGGDMLPPELAQILQRLRSDAHFMPPAQLKKMLNCNWPDKWLSAFKTFDVQPIAAASIGQVHKATLNDGRTVAIKVQYPGVAKSIDSDVANVGALLRMSGLLPKGFDMAPYLEEARNQLHQETDYLREGGFLEKFAAILSGDSRYIVPGILTDWTTDQVLTMSFVSGEPIENMANASQQSRDAIATDLIDLFLSELFDLMLMQTDPNFANYQFDKVAQAIILLDFGATRQLAPDVVELCRDILQAGLAGDDTRLDAALHQAGLFTQDTPQRHKDQIMQMMALAFGAITQEELFDFGQDDVLRKLQTAGIELANDGYVPPLVPMDMLFVQRKLGGIALLAKRLGARVPIADMARRYLPD